MFFQINRKKKNFLAWLNEPEKSWILYCQQTLLSSLVHSTSNVRVTSHNNWAFSKNNNFIERFAKKKRMMDSRRNSERWHLETYFDWVVVLVLTCHFNWLFWTTSCFCQSLVLFVGSVKSGKTITKVKRSNTIFEFTSFSSQNNFVWVFTEPELLDKFCSKLWPPRLAKNVYKQLLSPKTVFFFYVLTAPVLLGKPLQK